MISKLRPSYARHIPSPKLLASPLLDKVYQSCLKKPTNSCGSSSVLLIDGWKNTSSNTKISVAMLHNANGNLAFVNAWELQSEPADCLADIVYESIQLAKINYDADVYAVVSDNASNMIKMGKYVVHALWHSTCNSHIGNLLAGDVADKELIKKVVALLREFKQNILEKAILVNGGSHIKLPPETRWCYQRDSLNCLLKNLPAMKKALIDESLPNRLKTAVTNRIFDDSFIEEVKVMKMVLDPICVLTNICQNMTFNDTTRNEKEIDAMFGQP